MVKKHEGTANSAKLTLLPTRSDLGSWGSLCWIA